MRRSIQVGIAVLVLSVRLWSKFDLSYFLGRGYKTPSIDQELVTKGLILFIFLYIIAVKVLQQIIFRARMAQKDIALIPNWFPFIGNYQTLSSVSHAESKKDLGRNPMAILPGATLSKRAGILPPYYAVNGLSDAGGHIYVTNCEAAERLTVKDAKALQISEENARILHNFGGSSFLFSKQSK